MVCAKSGIAAPTVATLVRDPNRQDATALVVSPSCAEREIAVKKIYSDTTPAIDATGLSIGAVLSYPPVDSLLLGDNQITSFIASGPVLDELDLTNNKLLDLSGFQFPERLKRIILDENPLTGLRTEELPSSTAELYLRDTGITSLVPFQFPDGLRLLVLTGSKSLSTLNGLVLPPSLENLVIENSGVVAIGGVVFPKTLKKLIVSSTKSLVTFDVRQSDLDVLQSLDQFQVKGADKLGACADARGNLTSIKGDIKACVFDDAVFASKYASSEITAVPVRSTPAPSSFGNVSQPNSSSSDSTQLILIAVIVLVAVGVGAGIAYFFLRRRSSRRSDADNDNTKDTRTRTKTRTAQDNTDTNGLLGSTNSGFLENDVRNDPELIPHRLPQEELHLLSEIAKGGFGIVYRAKLYSQEVVVKQVSPFKTNSGDVLRRFMDEIRLYAKLDHPKIVRFVGLAWTNLLDLSLVMEYMSNGDLYSVLRADNKLPPERQQLEWFAEPSATRSKSLMALDVAEALVYLHSFSPSIIHRDLKAKNVLLTSDYVAKLGDFGISREANDGETMTGGVGTTAWIAPEVLQGERYSEKADIYSFGILLCEMDACGHPYNSQRSGEGGSMTDAKIAYLVSTASLKPTLKASCPRAIQSLIMDCLEFDPSKRPTAIELHYNLRKVREASLEWGFSGSPSQ